jgi:hypothetical protein
MRRKAFYSWIQRLLSLEYIAGPKDILKPGSMDRLNPKLICPWLQILVPESCAPYYGIAYGKG